MYELDHSRSWTEVSASDHIQEFSRPIRVSVWYPTTQTRVTPTMSLREFVHDPAPDEYFTRLNDLLEERYVGLFASVSQELYDSLLTLPLAAVKDAEPAVGSFPVVMYSPGGQASLPDNGVLAAFLASHGYIVGAVPQLEESPVVSRRDGYVAQVETQTRDIEYAMGVLQSLPQVDRRHLAVVGYSLGGLVALRMASRNPNVDAVVGLDPSFAYARNLDAVTGTGRLDIAALRTPILSLQAGNVESLSHYSPLIHDTLHFADRYTGYVGETVHGDFSEIKSMLIPALVSGEGLEPELVEAHRAYMVACQYVVNFLDGVLKDDLDGLAFVTQSSAANGLDPDLVQMTLVNGIGVPTEAGFVELLTNEGYDAAEQLLRDAIRAIPHVVLIREDVLDSIGRRMRGNGESSTAVGVFRLNVEAHPHSARAQDGLADAYLANGDSLQVIQTYQRLLEILPSDSSLSRARKEELRRNTELKLRILQFSKRKGSEPPSPRYPGAEVARLRTETHPVSGGIGHTA